MYTSVRTLTNRARPSPQNFAPPRSWTGSSTHGRVYVRSPCSDSRGARRAMTAARRSPASHALHCLRLPGWRNIRLFGAASGARRSGSQSAQSWPISAHLRRDCERRCPPLLILPVFTRNLRRSSGTAGEQTASHIRGRPDLCGTGRSDRRSDVKWLRRISGIIWIFTWRTIYLEIFRWHHMTKSLRFNPPPPPPGTDIRPRPGAPLIAVCAGAVAAPLVFVAATVAERVRGKSARTPSRRTG